MGAEFVIARVTARRSVRSAAIWGGAFAIYLAVSALGYAATYPRAAERQALAAGFGSNAGVNAIFGPTRHLDTVGGFTEWRGVGVLSLVAAVWGLLLGTRLLRGEEEAGRWELLLAGRTTRRRAGAEGVTGLAAGFLVLWAVPALVVAVVGRSHQVRFSVGDSLLLALASVACGAVFLLVAAIASQLAATRPQAAAYSGAVLAIAYAARAAADADPDLAWLRWLSPLGWSEQLRPLTGLRPIALLPMAGAVVAMGATAVWLAGRRDLGASSLPARNRSATSTRLLSGPTALTIRLVRPLALGWAAAIVMAGLLFGLVAKTAAHAIQQAGGVQGELARFGATGAGAQAYLGVAFLVIALLVTLAAASSVSALRGEEGEGRLDHLLARPVSRVTWLAGRIGAGAVMIAACGLLAALASWVGVRVQGADVDLHRLLQAGVNVVPPALFVLGIGVLTFGVRPRSASAVCYGLVAWSFLVLLVGSAVRANHWFLDLSLFRHMAAAPAVDPDWSSAATLTGLAALSAAAGAVLFIRRDLAGD